MPLRIAKTTGMGETPMLRNQPMPGRRFALQPSRRDVLAASLLTWGGMLVTPVGTAAQPRRAGLRVAHLTDMHVKPEHGSPAGYAKALQSLSTLSPAPEFLVTGGDHVMDALERPRARVNEQWDTYDKVLAENTRLKIYPVLGNHDVWGWSAKDAWDTEPGFGKQIALDRLKLSRGFYSFDAGAWHFVVLDNIARRGKGYYGDIDAEQLEWLKGDVGANGGKKPVAVISHIPLVSICALFFAYGEKGDKPPKDFWRIGDNLMQRNVKPLLQLLAQSNVKVCISGHIHLLDRIEYMGMSFICDGAVSGAWWGGPFQEVSEGYGVFDFFPDGTFDHQYITYGWTPPNA
jgi:Icc protein